MKILIAQGNALRIPLPSNSVQCIVTSPPYYGQRVYGESGEIGWEQTPTDFVNALVEVFNECHRVLRPDGVLWLNLGDTYFSKAKGTGGPSDKQLSNKGSRFKQKRKLESDGTVKPKDLVGIPWRVALRLQEAGWWLRNDIIWEKPNGMPTSATDRCTDTHEYIFLLAKSERYYYDQDAIREPYTEELNRLGGDVLEADGQSAWSEATGQASYRQRDMRPNKAGRNRRTIWRVNTTGFQGDHFATFPFEIPKLCIKASSKPGDIVLDPFGGSGTTAIVANQLGRIGVSLDLFYQYCLIAQEHTGLNDLNEWINGKSAKSEKSLDELPLFSLD